jgi:KDO2-lipid IV(A) lauroyltransferase
MIDYPVYILVRVLIGTLNLLPLSLRIGLLSLLVRFVALVLPAFDRVSLKNLELAFPEKDLAWRKGIVRKSCTSLARVIVDFARLQHLNSDWVKSHIECPLLERYRQIRRDQPGKGVMLVTGHLGSFELLAHCMAMYGHPISFVVRPFKLPRLNAWWTGIREAAGNKAISRTGAFKEVISDLTAGRDVAILFDQNVTRKHAVFVDWFGKAAATTRTTALAAIRTEAPVIVSSIAYVGDDRYTINAKECDFRDIYADARLSSDEKILRITATLAKTYEEMIRAHPEEWFWMHKRWKTTANEADENFYRS